MEQFLVEDLCWNSCYHDGLMRVSNFVRKWMKNVERLHETRRKAGKEGKEALWTNSFLVQKISSFYLRSFMKNFRKKLGF